jgi:2,4-dichlorophenol 6-monooxygenase
VIETDVLVVGCGPAGLTAAMALARQNIRVLAITKHRQLSPTPRAHVTNQRSLEIFRDFGIEQAALAVATPYTQMPDQVFLRSLVGEEYARANHLQASTLNEANSSASPCAMVDLPQHLLEPILFDAAVKLGANVRLHTELKSFDQDEEGITAQLEDRASGEQLRVRARYMIGADGGNSVVADALGLPFEGPGRIGGSLNIRFECDLAPYVAHRPGLLFYVVRSVGDADGPGLGILRCVKPWTSWIMIRGYAAGEQTPHLNDEGAIAVVRDYLGIADLEVKITGIDPWPMNSYYATAYHRGRVFCMGDAVHRHVPSNGLGSNTAIQDAYNLAWKLDLVLKGNADAGLLETYSEERAPVGKQVVERATRSLETYGPIVEAIGVPGALDSGQVAAGADLLKNQSPQGRARRDALRLAVQKKIHEFGARGIELNQFYRSHAIVHEGQSAPDSELDLELFHRPTTCPGAHLPHAWVQRNGHALSTLDLVGKGRFTLIAGVGGNAWTEAAEAVAKRFGIEVVAVAIGPGCAITDLYFQWAERCDIEEDGCLLVRPDGYIAWRCFTAEGVDANKRLADVVAQMLGREVSAASAAWHRHSESSSVVVE